MFNWFWHLIWSDTEKMDFRENEKSHFLTCRHEIAKGESHECPWVSLTYIIWLLLLVWTLPGLIFHDFSKKKMTRKWPQHRSQRNRSCGPLENSRTPSDSAWFETFYCVRLVFLEAFWIVGNMGFWFWIVGIFGFWLWIVGIVVFLFFELLVFLVLETWLLVGIVGEKVYGPTGRVNK